mmetsp:Transcript_25607/g.45418  ORF Transcript_25607/g.45418 Transcript_25607/m.45418 type:complete len:331 (-) Transcript_25607:507-1499(-)
MQRVKSDFGNSGTNNRIHRRVVKHLLQAPEISLVEFVQDLWRRGQHVQHLCLANHVIVVFGRHPVLRHTPWLVLRLRQTDIFVPLGRQKPSLKAHNEWCIYGDVVSVPRLGDDIYEEALLSVGRQLVFYHLGCPGLDRGDDAREAIQELLAWGVPAQVDWSHAQQVLPEPGSQNSAAPQPGRKLHQTGGHRGVRLREAEHRPQFAQVQVTHGKAPVYQLMNQLVKFLVVHGAVSCKANFVEEVFDRHHANWRQHLEQLCLEFLRSLRGSRKLFHKWTEILSTQEIVQDPMTQGWDTRWEAEEPLGRQEGNQLRFLRQVPQRQFLEEELVR